MSDLQVIERDVDGVIQLKAEAGICTVIAVEESNAARGSFDSQAAVLRREHDVLQQGVVSCIDVHNVARAGLIGRDQRQQAGHRRVGAFAAIGVVANGGRKKVASGGIVVDVEVVTRSGNLKFIVGDALRMN